MKVILKIAVHARVDQQKYADDVFLDMRSNGWDVSKSSLLIDERYSFIYDLSREQDNATVDEILKDIESKGFQILDYHQESPIRF